MVRGAHQYAEQLPAYESDEYGALCITLYEGELERERVRQLLHII